VTAVVESDDLQRRRGEVRRRELMVLLEQWAPADRAGAGDRLHYVFEIAGATDGEQAWLRQQPLPATPRSADELRAAGRRANAAASAAFLAGDYDRARDLIDEARAYGELFETEWVKMHAFIDAQSG
jgi:hypothetical protein